jgi:hypothetical protein
MRWVEEQRGSEFRHKRRQISRNYKMGRKRVEGDSESQHYI